MKEPTVPWYMNVVDRKSLKGTSFFNNQLIKYPNNSPDSLHDVVEFMKSSLGLSEILIFDLRNRDEQEYSTAVSKIGDFMILSTAKSGKHCESSFIELNKLLKKNYRSTASVEGNFNYNDEMKRQRRLARKPNLSKSLGSKLSKSNSPECWYMIDCHLDNIFVNILTKVKRMELNLEELYAPESEKAQYKINRENRIPEEQEEEKTVKFDRTHVSDENNVLLGLRRLALQRKREYSTMATQNRTDELRDLLLQVKVRKPLEINESVIALSKRDALNSLQSLKNITAAVETLDTTDVQNLDVHGLKFLFESSCPLCIPKEEESEYWASKSKFLLLLNTMDPLNYTPKNYLKDYLIGKKATGHKLSHDDLIVFLQMGLRHIGNKDTHSPYWLLYKNNNCNITALELFMDDDSILSNEMIVNLLIKSTTLYNKDKAHLNSLFELIDFLLMNSERSQTQLATPVIISIIDTLSNLNLWNSLWKFWNSIGNSVGYGTDNRPWAYFVNVILESNDLLLQRKVLEEGHLLWIVRNKVTMTPDLQNKISNLIELADHDHNSFTELKHYILQHRNN